MDLNAAFADPEIRAVLATIGGEDQITVVPHLDAAIIAEDPKPFLGYSDNTNLLNWSGPTAWPASTEDRHRSSSDRVPTSTPSMTVSTRRSVTGGRLDVTDPGESEDIGRDWNDPRALSEFGDREPTEPWTWAGPHGRSRAGPGVAASKWSSGS